MTINFLTFTKSFDGPTVAGGTPVLTLSIINLSATASVSGISFTDDLDAVLTGLVATNTPQADACGSSLAGTSFLTLTGGNLVPGGSCTLVVNLQVPVGAVPGSFPNTTSDLLLAGLSASAPATASLAIEPPPTFAKLFAPDTIMAGGATTLTLTIDNSASAVVATALDFTDTLPAGVVVATPSNAATTCTGGTVTAASGTGVVSYTGGTVGAGATCTVSVDLIASTPGAQVNLTGDLTSSSGNSGTATDTLTVAAFVVPTFAKVFAPASIAAGGTTTLTFTLDNTGSLVAATTVDFTDNLPAGVVVATPSNAATTCTGGTLTATSGSATITYTGGTVGASASCTVSVDVIGSTPGAQVNTTGDLTSSLGNSGTATDTLTVSAFVAPVFAKAFSPNPITVSQSATLLFTIDNLGSLVAATGIALTDNLPVGMALATPANGSTTCTGGTLSAPDGGMTVTYTGGTVAAAASCDVMVDVTALVSGDLVNTTEDLTSSLGSSGAAVATLTVEDNPAEIPLLGPWGFAWLISLLAFFGLRSLRRQRGH